MTLKFTLALWGGVALGVCTHPLPAPAAEPALLLDLGAVGTASGRVTRVFGSTGDGGRGVPVAGGFDCDGDGFVDAGFAAMQASPLGRNGAGEVALIFGDGTIGGSNLTVGFDAGVLKVAGVQEKEVTGAEIWIDDVTGDGLGDLLICRQNYTPEPGREGAGALHLLVGGSELRQFATNLAYLDLGAIPASITNTLFVGQRGCDRLGIWVRTGDITGDGVADIVVGSDQYDGPNEEEDDRGTAYIVRGGAHLSVSQTVDFAAFGATSLSGHVARIHPPAGSIDFHMGATVQIADLDGNGRGEVLAAAALNRAGAGIGLPAGSGCTAEGSGGSARGTVYIAWDDNFPTGLWPAGFQFSMTNAPGSRTIIEGDDFNDAFGEEMIGGLDFSGDGHAELFAGDLTADGINGNNAGVGHVFYRAETLRDLAFDLSVGVPTGIHVSVIEGPSAGALGADTVTQGDFDGDGLGDLVVGNPTDDPLGRGDAGSMHVLYGAFGGWPALIDLSPGNLPGVDQIRIAEIAGAKGGDVLCYSAAAGDSDQDGRTDIIVNEMKGDGVTTNAAGELVEAANVGNLLLISGAALLHPPPVLKAIEAPPPVRIAFASVAGASYFLQAVDTPIQGGWSNVLSSIVATGTVTVVTNGAEGAAHQFYRVGLE